MGIFYSPRRTRYQGFSCVTHHLFGLQSAHLGFLVTADLQNAFLWVAGWRMWYITQLEVQDIRGVDVLLGVGTRV